MDHRYFGMAMLSGMPIVEAAYLEKTVYCRRHKKKRINKKLEKKYGKKRIPVANNEIYITNGTIICGPTTARALKRIYLSL